MAEPASAAERASAVAGSIRAIERAFLLGVEGTTEIWLVRHADCYEEIVEPSDPSLSRTGREQARRLGERLRRLELSGIYSSDYLRAMETARAIGSDAKPDPRLREIGNDPTKLDVALNRYIGFTEPVEEVIARMGAAIGEAVEAHPGGRVIVVSHGAAILAYLCHVMRVEFGKLRLLPYYTSISVVRILGDRHMVGALADVAHLDGLPSL